MTLATDPQEFSQEALRSFFNTHHDKLLCTANQAGEPSIALMGTPKLLENGDISFEISDPQSLTLHNVQQNKAVCFLAYTPGERARDYTGVRIYAEATEVLTAGEKLEQIRDHIRARHGAEKAAELLATITCSVRNIRPVVDRGQQWHEAPFEQGGAG
ncbi:MAG: pyridoxamine 5'-phosphate oxidase family protein [Janthinobacterium lividum]